VRNVVLRNGPANDIQNTWLSPAAASADTTGRTRTRSPVARVDESKTSPAEKVLKTFSFKHNHPCTEPIRAANSLVSSPPMYSIKAVSQATGLTVETLRAWERRYRAVVPRRDDMGRRVYAADDVLRLRRLREATERGHPIGRLAGLDARALGELLDAPSPPRRPATSPDAAAVTATGVFSERIIDAARRFKPAECEQALTLAIALLPPARLIGEVLEPVLRDVGERWHSGQFSIAQERLVSTAVRKHIGLVVETYDRAAVRPAVVFATLPGERHELGLLMSALICASEGFKVHYLGPDLPAEEIARYAKSVGAAVVALSVVLLDGVTEVPAQVHQLVEELGTDIAVWLGGSAALGLRVDALPGSCAVIRDQAELAQRLDLLSG
jgi:methanogenic corrinoid protein MtbC1